MRRRPKSQPETQVNGWLIQRQPNSFAERWAWAARALDAEGFLTARHGFNTKGEAVAFAEKNTAPTVRGAPICDI